MPARTILSSMWDDDRVAEAPAHAQLIFVRLFSGAETTAGGATQVRAKRLAADHNLSRDEVEVALTHLVEVDLVRRYPDGWLWMPSWIKHNVHGSGMAAAARKAARGCPEALRKAINRAVDAKHPRQDKETDTDGTRTRKVATSRHNGKGTPDPPPDPDGTHPPSLRAKGQGQGGLKDPPTPRTEPAPPGGGPACPDPRQDNVTSIDAARRLAESLPEGSTAREAILKGLEAGRRMREGGR